MSKDKVTKTEEEIAEAEARLAQLRSERASMSTVRHLKPEVTVVIPVFNAWLTLNRILFKIEKGAQATPCKLIMGDNGSTDPCADILASPRFPEYLRVERNFPDVRVLTPTPLTPLTQYPDLEDVPQNEGECRCRNIAFMKKKLVCKVDTPYVLFLDADVEMPNGGIGILLEGIKSDPKLGFLGIQYDWVVDHVKAGCTIAPTKLIDGIDIEPPGCICRFLNKRLIELGYKVEHVPNVMARHLKFEL